MAGLLTETVNAYFTVTGATQVFTLDDPVKGVLDSATYLLSGDVAVDISSSIRSVQIDRGRARELDEMLAGVAQVVANNRNRTFDPSYAAGPYFGNIAPGKRVTIATNGKTRFDGKVDDWNFDYPIDTDSTASFDVVDALADLGGREFDAWTTTASQTPGTRLASILDRAEVNFGANRALDTGTSTLQADNVSWGSNVLNYCQLVVKCDLGQFFASKDGILTFYGRNRPKLTTGAPTFTDNGGGGIVYSGIGVEFGTELLFNRVSVDATGFAKQTVTDQTSIDLYGVRSLSLSGLPLETQAQASELANYLLNLYKAPTSRFSSVTTDLHRLSAADQSTVLDLDIGSVIRLVYSPNKVAPAVDKYCLVEGVSDLIGEKFHSVTLKLSNLVDGFAGSPFILDDATFGVLDTVGAGVLFF